MQPIGYELTHLSLHRAGMKTPRVLTNEERLAAIRPFLPAQLANAMFARSEAERYAAEQGPCEVIANYADRRGV